VIDVRRAALAVLCVLVAAPAAHAAFDPVYEAQNYRKIDERWTRDAADPEFQARLRLAGVEREARLAQILATDPERGPFANLCAHRTDGCAGDVRLYDWDRDPDHIRRPILFTARNGATISGHVWATRPGPRRRPGVVVTPGSVQAPEELYWFAPATLAERGYVVLTFDVQGQGYSDTFGAVVDRNEGVPAQQGRPFYDQTEDALDFFLSTARRPYVPRRSCTTGTSHAAKQRRRVREGRNPAANPLWRMLDRSRIGLAGQSFGAAGVSFVGQRDPRVDAIVAWDDLRPATAAPATDCPSAPHTRVPAGTPRVPGLGISNDYGLFRQPNTRAPDPEAKSAASRSYTAAGVDSGEIVIRGGTHYEAAYIPNPYFSATLRGIDLVAWYTGAWFDRHLRGDRGALRRLFTDRWRNDRHGAAVDPLGDGNLLSTYHRSRLAVGGVRCEDLRRGCPALAPDGEPPDYSYLREAAGE